MEKDDKGCPMIRMGVSGWMFLLVPAYPGSPRQKAVKRLCVCVCVCVCFFPLSLHTIIIAEMLPTVGEHRRTDNHHSWDAAYWRGTQEETNSSQQQHNNTLSQYYCRVSTNSSWLHNTIKNSHICPYLQTLDLQNMHKSFRKHFVFLELFHSRLFAFDALTLLAGRQEKHPACKNLVMRCWHGNLSGVRGRFFAYGSADATAIPKPHRLLPHLNPDWFYLSGTNLPKLSRKRPLNGYSVAKSIPIWAKKVSIQFDSILATESIFFDSIR